MPSKKKDPTGGLPAEILGVASQVAASNTVEPAPLPVLPRGETPTALDTFKQGTLGTVVGAGLLRLNSPNDEVDTSDWRKNYIDYEIKHGYHASADERSIIEDARNPADWKYRMGILDERREYMKKMGEATGVEKALHFGAGVLGGMSTSGVEMAFGASVAVPMAMRAGAAAHSLGNLVRMAGAQIPVEAASSVFRQRLMQSETMLDQLGMDMLGAAAFEIPSIVFAGARIGRAQAARVALDTAQADLISSIDSGAAKAIVEAHAKNVSELRERIVAAALQEGDTIGAEVWRRVGPDAKVAEIDAVIRDLKTQEREVLIAMSAKQLPEPTVFTRPDRAVDDVASAEVRAFTDKLVVEKGIAISQEAGAILHRAYKTWDSTLPASVKEMQARFEKFYELRADKLDNYKGIANWLDSPGLVFQLEKSQVTRMLGSMLVESASGVGKREFSAALDYENVRKTLEHKYVRALGEALTAHRSRWEELTALLGFGSAKEKAFWYDTALDRLSRREHIKDNGIGEYASTATEPMKRAARLLDGFFKDSADALTAHGHAEGEAIAGGGFVGHMPYHVDAREMSRLYREEPEVFAAIREILRGQFEDKVLTPALDDLAKNWESYLTDHMNNLRGTVAALQDKLAGMEQARRAVQNVRDDVTTVNANRKEVWATIQKIQEQERALRDELADLKRDPAGSAGESALSKETDEDFAALARGETLPGEYHREDAASFLERVLLSGKLEDDSAEYVFGQQLLATMREDATPATIILRPRTKESARSWFGMQGDVSVLSLRPHAVIGGKPTPDIIVSRLLKEDVQTLLHEFGHYRTQAIIYGVQQGRITNPNIVAAVARLEKLRGEVIADLKGKAIDYQTEYGLKDAHEFVGQFFSSPTFQAELHKLKRKGESQFSRLLTNLLDILRFDRKASAFTELHSVISDLLDIRGSVPISGRSINFADNPRVAEINKQLGELKSAKEQLRGAHKEAKKLTDEATANRKAVQGLTNVEAFKNIERSLAAHRARLSDAEANPGVVVEKMRLDIAKKARDKADNLTGNYLRQAMSDPEQRIAGAELRFADMAQEMLTENWEGDTIGPKLAEDFRTKLAERIHDKTRTELDLTKAVTVKGKTVRLLDVFEVDGQAMVKRAAHRFAGKAALARKGLDDTRMQQAALEAMQVDGASPKAIDEMKFIFDMFSGRVDPGSNPQAWAAWRNWVYTARLGKLGEAMLSDIPGIVSTLGIGALPKMLGSMAYQVFSGQAFVHRGGLTELGKQLTEVAPGTMGMDHRLHTIHAEGGGGESAVSTTGWATRAISRGAQLVSWLSGANTVNTAVHRAATPLIAEELIQAVAAGKSAFTDARLADAGLSPENLALVQKYYAEFDKGRKPGERVQFDKWKGEEGQYAADLMVGAIQRATFQTVQKALLGEQPSWSQRTQLGQLIAQLHSFGMIAAEKQAARNFAHGDANAAIFMTVGLAWASLLYVARVHANAASQPGNKRDEYIQKRMSGKALTAGIFMLWNASGIMPEAVSLGQVMWGNREEAGAPATRSGGPIAAYGLAADAVEAVQTTGNWLRDVDDTSKLLKEWKQTVPLGNTRLIEFLTKD